MSRVYGHLFSVRVEVPSSTTPAPLLVPSSSDFAATAGCDHESCCAQPASEASPVVGPLADNGRRGGVSLSNGAKTGFTIFNNIYITSTSKMNSIWSSNFSKFFNPWNCVVPACQLNGRTAVKDSDPFKARIIHCFNQFISYWCKAWQKQFAVTRFPQVGTVGRIVTARIEQVAGHRRN